MFSSAGVDEDEPSCRKEPEEAKKNKGNNVFVNEFGFLKIYDALLIFKSVLASNFVHRILIHPTNISQQMTVQKEKKVMMSSHVERSQPSYPRKLTVINNILLDIVWDFDSNLLLLRNSNSNLEKAIKVLYIHLTCDHHSSFSTDDSTGRQKEFCICKKV